MPNQPPTTVLGVRLQPAVLRQVHQLAEDRDLTISDAARHLLNVGLKQLQATA